MIFIPHPINKQVIKYSYLLPLNICGMILLPISNHVAYNRKCWCVQKVLPTRGVMKEATQREGKEKLLQKLLRFALHCYDVVLVHGIRWSQVLEKLRMGVAFFMITFLHIQCMKR